MNELSIDRAKAIALEYVGRKLDFARVDVIDVSKEENVYSVTLSLEYSPKQIETIVAEGDPKEEEDRRVFFSGEFIVTIFVEGDSVVDIKWDKTQLS